MKTRQVSTTRILAQAQAFGASLAGCTPLSALREPTHDLLAGWKGDPEQASILVLALEHPDSKPELDWWDGEAGTEGNRRLIALSEKLRRYLAKEFGVISHPLPYHPWKGGILLKDAAVLAGLGCIGDHNLLITPQYGTRVRLRALLVDLAVEPVEIPEFDPCADCNHPCWQACPQQAFASGAYHKASCEVQMAQDEQNAAEIVRYCRACEWACPVGR